MQHKDMELLERIRDFIIQYQAREGRSPSYRAVMRDFRLVFCNTHKVYHMEKPVMG
ncbi:MAG: hypothetical protein LBS99_05595 [Clostridiales bacterium]|jgi:hypothetical protein|nr:hypothetical protein [Clostridiales bacterium]